MLRKPVPRLDKNAGSVFEQRLRWPVGRAPGMGRVITSRAARTAKANAEGTAQRHTILQRKMEQRLRWPARVNPSGFIIWPTASGQGEVAFEPLLVVRAMEWQRNDIVYPARNYSLTRQNSSFVRQHGCLSTVSTARRRAAKTRNQCRVGSAPD